MAGNASAVPKSVPKKLATRVMHWDDERAIGNSIIISLNHGWRSISSDCHTVGTDTVKEAIVELRNTEPCVCACCLKQAPGGDQ